MPRHRFGLECLDSDPYLNKLNFVQVRLEHLDLKTIDFVSHCKYGENRYDKNVEKTFFGFQGSLNFTQQT